MDSHPPFDRKAIAQRLIDTLRRELPWSNNRKAERAAYHAQDLAEAGLAILCDEPTREVNEEQRAEFVLWAADTQLMLIVTLIKEWGLIRDESSASSKSSTDRQVASDDDLVNVMLRASYLLWCLGDLNKEGEEKVRRIGGEDWMRDVQEELRVDQETVVDLHQACIAAGMSEKRASSFILTGFGCGFSNMMLGAAIP